MGAGGPECYSILVCPAFYLAWGSLYHQQILLSSLPETVLGLPNSLLSPHPQSLFSLSVFFHNLLFEKKMQHKSNLVVAHPQYCTVILEISGSTLQVKNDSVSVSEITPYPSENKDSSFQK